ncbi:MAG: hypothetical protein NVS4B13_00010 [Candidatus Elarobacter sp.]
MIATAAHGVVANTALPATDGSFRIRGISSGGYTIAVANVYTTNAGVTYIASGPDTGAAPSARAVVGPSSQVVLPALRD